MHFFAFVLFEPKEWDIYAGNVQAAVRERIRRYDVHLTVPEYRPACRCMGENAWRADSIAFECRHAKDIPGGLWTGLGYGLKRPDKHSRNCGGSGRRLEPTTLNPYNRYDYWQMHSFGAERGCDAGSVLARKRDPLRGFPCLVKR